MIMPINSNNNLTTMQNMSQLNSYQDRYMNFNQQQTQQPINNSNMNFLVVENIQKAREQIVPYGYTMWMRDSSEPYQYVKSVDNVGTPTFKVLKVEDITDKLNEQSIENIPYVSKQDFQDLTTKVEQLQNSVNYYNNILNQALLPKEEEVKKVGRPPKEKVGENNG